MRWGRNGGGVAYNAAAATVQLFVLGLVTLSAGLFAGADAARADSEQLLMPFACNVERGQVTLTPAPERHHRIVGAHERLAHTACAPGNPDRCRTWQIHKFDMICGGARVPWLAVVNATLNRSQRRAHVENGRLHLRQNIVWRTASSNAERQSHLSFPNGYAPLLGIGRIVGGATLAPTVVAAGPQSTQQPTPRDLRINKPPVEAPVTLITAATVSPTESTVESSVTSSWVTETAAVAGTVQGPWRMERVAALAAALMAVWTMLIATRRRSATARANAGQTALAAPDTTAVPVGDNDAAPPSDTHSDAADCAAMISRAVNLHRALRDAIELMTNPDLRDVLSDDLAKVQTSLLSSTLTGQVAGGDWKPVRVTASQALVDLERIARIITGVVSGPAIVKPSVSIPATAAEAFEILGVNPDASRPVVKKIVDGLRQSWHPDHAKDEADRCLREDRMKQINSAWDLIRDKQQAA